MVTHMQYLTFTGIQHLQYFMYQSLEIHKNSQNLSLLNSNTNISYVFDVILTVHRR